MSSVLLSVNSLAANDLARIHWALTVMILSIGLTCIVHTMSVRTNHIMQPTDHVCACASAGGWVWRTRARTDTHATQVQHTRIAHTHTHATRTQHTQTSTLKHTNTQGPLSPQLEVASPHHQVVCAAAGTRYPGQWGGGGHARTRACVHDVHTHMHKRKYKHAPYAYMQVILNFLPKHLHDLWNGTLIDDDACKASGACLVLFSPSSAEQRSILR